MPEVCATCLGLKESVKYDFIDPSKGIHGIGVGSHLPGQGHHLWAYVEAGVQVPISIDGIRIEKKITEPIRSFADYGLVRAFERYPVVKTFDTYARPVSGGNSVGAYSRLLNNFVTGTIGMVFQQGTQLFILSSNHVLAGIDSVQRNGAVVGAPLWQPGSFFSGSPDTGKFASLYRWGKINETAPNETDWAVGLVTNPADAAPNILNLGQPTVIADPSPSMGVRKMGALTGLTASTVLDTNATLQINYEDLFTATFDNQIVVDNGAAFGFAAPGDSGSVVVTSAGGQVVAVGLICSGSPTIAVANKMTLLAGAAGMPLPIMGLAPQPAAGSSLPMILAFVGAASYLLTRILWL